MAVFFTVHFCPWHIATGFLFLKNNNLGDNNDDEIDFFIGEISIRHGLMEKK